MTKCRAIACVLLVGLLPACQSPVTPMSRDQATQELVQEGFFRPRGSSPKDGRMVYELGMPGLSTTNVVNARNACEGAVGSVLPPFGYRGCVEHVVNAPLDILIGAVFAIDGSDVANGHVMLSGIDKYWVKQLHNNYCWAATLQTTRDYLGLPHLSQEEIVAVTDRTCPGLRDQAAGADLYQIINAVRSLHSLDQAKAPTPHFCNDPECIVYALTGNHPVIMYKDGHAVIVVGVDYVYSEEVARERGSFFIVPERYHILDPGGSGQVEIRSSLQICGADAFLAY